MGLFVYHDFQMASFRNIAFLFLLVLAVLVIVFPVLVAILVLRVVGLEHFHHLTGVVSGSYLSLSLGKSHWSGCGIDSDSLNTSEACNQDTAMELFQSHIVSN